MPVPAESALRGRIAPGRARLQQTTCLNLARPPSQQSLDAGLRIARPLLQPPQQQTEWLLACSLILRCITTLVKQFLNKRISDHAKAACRNKLRILSEWLCEGRHIQETRQKTGLHEIPPIRPCVLSRASSSHSLQATRQFSNPRKLRGTASVASSHKQRGSSLLGSFASSSSEDWGTANAISYWGLLLAGVLFVLPPNQVRWLDGHLRAGPSGHHRSFKKCEGNPSQS